MAIRRVDGGRFSGGVQNCGPDRIGRFLHRITDRFRTLRTGGRRLARAVGTGRRGLGCFASLGSSLGGSVLITRRTTSGIGGGTGHRTRVVVHRTRGRTASVISRTGTGTGRIIRGDTSRAQGLAARAGSLGGRAQVFERQLRMVLRSRLRIIGDGS